MGEPEVQILSRTGSGCSGGCKRAVDAKQDVNKQWHHPPARCWLWRKRLVVDTKGGEEEDRQLQLIKHDENSERRDWNENGGD